LGKIGVTRRASVFWTDICYSLILGSGYKRLCVCDIKTCPSVHMRFIDGVTFYFDEKYLRSRGGGTYMHSQHSGG
jgi:hypothetical protein